MGDFSSLTSSSLVSSSLASNSLASSALNSSSLNTTSLMVGLIFGSIGVSYCIYGKKRSHLVAFLAGIFLIGLPYAIDNNAVLIIVSLIIMTSPKFIKL
jgi:hypothetical protein